jgi:hypothetical protein
MFWEYICSLLLGVFITLICVGVGYKMGERRAEKKKLGLE